MRDGVTAEVGFGAASKLVCLGWLWRLWSHVGGLLSLDSVGRVIGPCGRPPACALRALLLT